MKLVQDPGLQPQRTALAWQRTGLAVLVNALVILRCDVPTSNAVVTTLGVLLFVAGLGVAAFGVWRARALTQGHSAPAAPTAAILGVAGVAVIVGAAGLVVIARA